MTKKLINSVIRRLERLLKEAEADRKQYTNRRNKAHNIWFDGIKKYNWYVRKGEENEAAIKKEINVLKILTRYFN